MSRILTFGQPLGGVMQIAYIVEDLHTAMGHWTNTLGIGPFFLVEHLDPTNTRYRGAPTEMDASLAIAFSGSMSFELIQQHNAVPSVFREIIDARGYGFHHCAVSAADFDAEVARLGAGGRDVAMSARLGDGSRVAYMDTVAETGGFTEVIEMTPGVESHMTMMRDAAASWDGTDPIRPLEPSAGAPPRLNGT